MIDFPVSQIPNRTNDLRNRGWVYKSRGNLLTHVVNTCPYPPGQSAKIYLDNYEPHDVVVLMRHPLDVWKEYAHLLRVMTETEHMKWLWK